MRTADLPLDSVTVHDDARPRIDMTPEDVHRLGDGAQARKPVPDEAGLDEGEEGGLRMLHVHVGTGLFSSLEAPRASGCPNSAPSQAFFDYAHSFRGLAPRRDRDEMR